MAEERDPQSARYHEQPFSSCCYPRGKLAGLEKKDPTMEPQYSKYKGAKQQEGMKEGRKILRKGPRGGTSDWDLRGSVQEGGGWEARSHHDWVLRGSAA